MEKEGARYFREDKIMKLIKTFPLSTLLLIAVLVYGCAGLQTVTNKICNPTAEEQTTADQMLAAIDTAQVALGIIVPSVEIVQASTVLKTIRSGGCFFLNELSQAFSVVDSLNTKKAMLVKRGITTLPQYQALRKYVQ
jgi:hypothetical protein